MRALVVGRFQPLHKGHVAVIRRALEECVDVVVAVGSTQGKPTLRNPFTFTERQAMLHAIFPGLRVEAVPDIHDPPHWVAHTQGITGKVDVVYGNDDATLDLFETAGVRVVRTGLVQREDLEGKAIRALLAEGDAAWRKLVPDEVAKQLLALDAERRMLQLAD